MSGPLKRVLFVCIGNSCRSQMAEGFARTYGVDVLVPASAGLAAAQMIAPDTLAAMDEKGIDLRDQFPKSLYDLDRGKFDLVINMSGHPLPEDISCPIREWVVADPVRLKYSAHCAVRDRIEHLVMYLILELRRDQAEPTLRVSGFRRSTE